MSCTSHSYDDNLEDMPYAVNDIDNDNHEEVQPVNNTVYQKASNFVAPVTRSVNHYYKYSKSFILANVVVVSVVVLAVVLYLLYKYGYLNRLKSFFSSSKSVVDMSGGFRNVPSFTGGGYSSETANFFVDKLLRS
jgi:hypothetical protein